jgi:glycosidase
MLAVGIALLTGCVARTGADRPAPSPPSDGPLHVASPDWRDQVIYFAMIDRFDDGDPGNNDQGAGEFDPADGARYSGGDLAGLRRRLDYIQALGATTLWITPPVAHRWWDPAARYGGYHGYWAEHFAEVDRHFGTLRDYQQLSRELHGRGMYLVQDIVVNHTGNFFSYRDAWNPGDPLSGFALQADHRGRTAPSQSPFDLNDVRQPGHRVADIYHWTPAITDYRDPQQEQRFQLADLDDLNTENPRVRAALRQSYNHWIEQAGVDGYRVDTAFYVPREFFGDFLHADDPRHPGILRTAAASGRKQFHVFGEGFGIDRAYEDTQARKIDAYMGETGGRKLMPGMINFPLYGTLGDVFARGRPTAELGYRIRSMMRVHAAPALMPTFVDNHDVDRFLAGGSEPGLRQALLAILTLPGIPTIYYATEQGFTGQRAAMFRNGHQSGGRDHFDSDSKPFRFLQEAIALRRTHRVFSRGTPTVLSENPASGGVLAYRMQSTEATALVVFNSADHDALLDGLDLQLSPGTRLAGVFGIQARPADLVVPADGRISIPLAAREGWVWLVSADRGAIAPAAAAPELHPLGAEEFRDDFSASGSALPNEVLRLVVDGDLSSAHRITADSNGHWRAMIDTGNMIDPAIEHRLVVWSESRQQASPSRPFKVHRSWQQLIDQLDPGDDDHGPGGHYQYPSDSGWGVHKQLDIRRLRVFTSGAALRVELFMHDITDVWNPSLGFDHVAFSLFFSLPGRTDGAQALPQQNARMPEDLRWQYRLRSHGWSNAMFSAAGADASQDGAVVTPGARIEVDRGQRMVRFTLPAAALGAPPDLRGLRIYATTWDYDGGYKALRPQADAHSFGGGDGARDPLIMDDALISLPAR